MTQSVPYLCAVVALLIGQGSKTSGERHGGGPSGAWCAVRPRLCCCTTCSVCASLHWRASSPTDCPGRVPALPRRSTPSQPRPTTTRPTRNIVPNTIVSTHHHHSLLTRQLEKMAMLPRAARPALQGLARSSATAGFHSSATQMATLRELEQRVKSVRNIEKITKVSIWADRKSSSWT